MTMTSDQELPVPLKSYNVPRMSLNVIRGIRGVRCQYEVYEVYVVNISNRAVIYLAGWWFADSIISLMFCFIYLEYAVVQFIYIDLEPL